MNMFQLGRVAGMELHVPWSGHRLMYIMVHLNYQIFSFHRQFNCISVTRLTLAVWIISGHDLTFCNTHIQSCRNMSIFWIGTENQQQGGCFRTNVMMPVKVSREADRRQLWIWLVFCFVTINSCILTQYILCPRVQKFIDSNVYPLNQFSVKFQKSFSGFQGVRFKPKHATPPTFIVDNSQVTQKTTLQIHVLNGDVVKAHVEPEPPI